MRFVSEALGAEVGWEGSTKTVTISQGDKEIKIVIGKKDYTINGEKNLMDTEGAAEGRQDLCTCKVCK